LRDAIKSCGPALLVDQQLTVAFSEDVEPYPDMIVREPGVLDREPEG
jgi:hypothetical protein